MHKTKFRFIVRYADPETAQLAVEQFNNKILPTTQQRIQAWLFIPQQQRVKLFVGMVPKNVKVSIFFNRCNIIEISKLIKKIYPMNKTAYCFMIIG